MKALGMAIAVVVALGTTAQVAGADVRSGSSDAGVLTASYDQDGGRITLSVAASSFTGQVKTYCSGFPQPATSAGGERPVDIAISQGSATASGGDSVSVEVVPDPSGGRLAASFAAPQLNQLDLRCIEGTADGRAVLLYFDGFSHETLTPSAAESAVRKDLVATWGTEPIRYVSCPASRVTDTALCRYKIGSASGTVRVGTYTVDEGETSLTTSRVRNQAYRQKASKCSAKYQRDEVAGSRVVVDKRLVAPKIFCFSDVVRMLQARAVKAYPSVVKAFTLKQTPAAGFEPLSSFKCTPRGKRAGAVVTYRFTCSNKLGDKVTYSFKVGRKGGKRPA